MRETKQQQPYYEDESCVIYHGDCREILPTLERPDAIVSDPPYGISLKTSSTRRGRLAAGRDWETIAGDDEPFDPSHLIEAAGVVILMGANHYADKLPPSQTWLVWDKVDQLPSKRDVGFNNMADCELAWCNVGGPARIFRHHWMGYFRASEARDRYHPTQKPTALMRWLIEHWCRDAETICDPYMGSGTTLRAAKDLGRKAIGIEVNESYCETAAKRLGQGVLAL